MQFSRARHETGETPQNAAQQRPNRRGRSRCAGLCLTRADSVSTSVCVTHSHGKMKTLPTSPLDFQSLDGAHDTELGLEILERALERRHVGLG